MTEDEAAGKWCPFTRVDQVHISPNRSSLDEEVIRGSACIGSSCMTWRKIDNDNYYCGLAGKP